MDAAIIKFCSLVEKINKAERHKKRYGKLPVSQKTHDNDCAKLRDVLQEINPRPTYTGRIQ